MKAYLNFGTITQDKSGRKVHTNAIQGVGEWVDISPLILDSVFSRTMRIGESGRFARSVLKFSMKPTLGKRYIASEILTAEGDIRAKFLNDDGTPYFIGTIRPTASLTATSYLDNISLEVIDDSYFLEWVNLRDTVIRSANYVYNPSKKNESLVHILLAYTGGNLNTLKITADSDVGTPTFNAMAKIEKGKGVKTVLDDVFYEYNLQYKFLEDGTMHIIRSDFNASNKKPIRTLTDADFVKKLSVSRSEDGRGGVVVKWMQGYTGFRTIAKFDLSRDLGNSDVQTQFMKNGKVDFFHPVEHYPSVEFPSYEKRILEINIDNDVDDTDKKLLKIYNDTVVPYFGDDSYAETFKDIGFFGIHKNVQRLPLNVSVDASKINDNKISGFLTFDTYGGTNINGVYTYQKHSHFSTFEFRAKCLFYDEGSDYYEYILGDDNMGANEYTEYKCKYIVGTNTAPSEIINLANRLLIERENGGTTYSTEMKKDKASKLTVGGVYTLNSAILGVNTLVRVVSINDKGNSVNGRLSTIKLQGWQDVGTIGTGKTTFIENNTKAELKKQFRLEASQTIVDNDAIEDGVISIRAVGDVVDLYKSDITWHFNGSVMPSSYKTTAYILNIPMSAFENATTLISAECKSVDGEEFTTPLTATITITKPKGEKGDKGDKGDIGEKGDKGDKGEDASTIEVALSPSSYTISSRGLTVREQKINIGVYKKNLVGETAITLKGEYGDITVSGANESFVITIPKGTSLQSFSFDISVNNTVLRSNTVSATIQESRAKYLGIYKTAPTKTDDGEPLMDGDYFLSSVTSDKEKDGLSPNTPYIYKSGAFSPLETTDKNYSSIMGTILGDALENGGISDDNPMYTFISKLATKDAFIQSLFSQDIKIQNALQSNNFKWEENDKQGFKLDAKSGMAYLQDAVFGGEIDSKPLTTNKTDVQLTSTTPKENLKYNLGSSDKRWSNIYADTLMGKIAYASSILPNTASGDFVGLPNRYFTQGAFGTLYTDVLKTINGTYHLGNLINSSEKTTAVEVIYGRQTSMPSALKTYTIYWQGLLINSYPQRYAILTGSCPIGKNEFEADDKVAKVNLPYNFKQPGYNWGNTYIVFASPYYTTEGWKGFYAFGSLPLVRETEGQYSHYNKTSNYFCLNGETFYKPTCTGFQVLVVGAIS